MGDVGKLDPRTEGLNYSFDVNAQPIHTVELSPYYIQKYRVTIKTTTITLLLPASLIRANLNQATAGLLKW